MGHDTLLISSFINIPMYTAALSLSAQVLVQTSAHFIILRMFTFSVSPPEGTLTLQKYENENQ
jgi:hypothetical protein